MMKKDTNQRDNKIIERELLRKKLYEEHILKWLVLVFPSFTYKEVCHLALRYIFNKNITKKEGDDPVFITTRSLIAETQMRKDIIYNKLNIDPQKIINGFEDRIRFSASQIDDTKIKNDSLVTMNRKKIIYQYKKYNDISSLALKNPQHIDYVLALNIRYTYIKLMNHGLARKFDHMGYTPQESTEGFASAFNHYFDKFCSAFPDLEKPFGSQGSFFDFTGWTTDTVFVNPPFDESLMTCAMERIYDYLLDQNDNSYDEKRKFIFTLPNWTNYPEIEDLKISKWTTLSHVYKKGELPFIDYMNNEKIVYPCDIAEITLQANKKRVEPIVEPIVELKKKNIVFVINEYEETDEDEETDQDEE
jgi:hypothetical protein